MPKKPPLPGPKLAALANLAVPSQFVGNRSPLEHFFAPGSERRADLEAYLTTLRKRGVRLSSKQVTVDLNAAYPTLRVAPDAIRRWLPKHYPDLLPWK